MLDAVVLGTTLGSTREDELSSPGLIIPPEDVDKVKKIFRRVSGRELEKDQSSIFVKSAGTVGVTLRKNCFNNGTWYLNIDGNPTKFLIGNNVYGTTEDVSAQIVGVFKRCLKAIEKRATERAREENPRADEQKFPEGVWQNLEAHEIHLNQLELATYSGPLEDKELVLDKWKFMYRRTNLLNEDGKHSSLASMLGLKYREYGNSMQIRRENSQGRPIVMFTAYDKEREIKDNEGTDTMKIRRTRKVRGEAFEPDVVTGAWKHAWKYRLPQQEVPMDIRNRLRLEIGLTSVWFSGHKIRTLARLEKFLYDNHGGSWSAMARHETVKIMQQACLIDMWRLTKKMVLDAAEAGSDHIEGLNDKVSLNTWISLLDARSEIDMPVNTILGKLKGGTSRDKYHQKLDETLENPPIINYTNILPSANIRAGDKDE